MFGNRHTPHLPNAAEVKVSLQKGIRRADMERAAFYWRELERGGLGQQGWQLLCSSLTEDVGLGQPALVNEVFAHYCAWKQAVKEELGGKTSLSWQLPHARQQALMALWKLVHARKSRLAARADKVLLSLLDPRGAGERPQMPEHASWWSLSCIRHVTPEGFDLHRVFREFVLAFERARDIALHTQNGEDEDYLAAELACLFFASLLLLANEEAHHVEVSQEVMQWLPQTQPGCDWRYIMRGKGDTGALGLVWLYLLSSSATPKPWQATLATLMELRARKLGDARSSLLLGVLLVLRQEQVSFDALPDEEPDFSLWTDNPDEEASAAFEVVDEENRLFFAHQGLGMPTLTSHFFDCITRLERPWLLHDPYLPQARAFFLNCEEAYGAKRAQMKHMLEAVRPVWLKMWGASSPSVRRKEAA